MTRIVHIMSVLAVFAGVFVPGTASAQPSTMVAVLPVKQADDAGLSASELEELTALARATAADVLTGHSIVMTEENMQRILKGMGLTLEQCQAEVGDCAVEIARKLQADHVVTGKVRRAFGKLTLNLELYATDTGALLVSKRVTVKSKEQFEGRIRPAMASALQALPGLQLRPAGAVSLQEHRDTTGSDWRSKTGALKIVQFHSTPPGATVLVNGEVVCQGDPRCSRPLPPGMHEVQMLLPRHVSRKEMIDTGRTAKVEWELEEDFARLSVDTDPPGVDVIVDGTALGPGPHDDLELTTGNHVIQAGGKACFKEHRIELQLDRGDRTTRTLQPIERKAGLVVRTTDESGNAVPADVYSGSTRLGQAYAPIMLGVCSRDLSVRTEDNRRFPVTASLQENQDVEANVLVPRELSAAEKRQRGAAERAKEKQEELRAALYRSALERWEHDRKKRFNFSGEYFWSTGGLLFVGAATFMIVNLAIDPTGNSDTTREEAQETLDKKALGGGIAAGIGAATVAAGLIYYFAGPDPPEEPSSAESSSSRWSAGPTALGDGFQLGWSSTW